MTVNVNRRRGGRVLTAGATAAIGFGGLVAATPVAVGSTHTPTVWHAHPDPTAEGVALTAVDADRSHDAWAVGQQFSVKHPNKPARAAVEHWNGKRWRGAKAPAGAMDLSSVSARSPKDVWAGGLHNVTDGPMVVWHFNGKKWKRITAKGLPHLNTGSVLAVKSHVWLVGVVDTGRPHGGAVIASYNAAAKKWTVLRADRGGGFFGVTALSATSAWAVGSTGQFGDGHPLISHWDGSTWTTQTFPDLDGQLLAVAAHSDTDVMAVGSHSGDVSSSMFTLQRVGDVWTPSNLSGHLGDLLTAVSAGPGTEYWGDAGGSSGAAAFYVRFVDGEWHAARGAYGTVKVASGRKYRVPQSFAVARVPHSNTTLSVGYGERFPPHHYPTYAAALESTTQ
jgi:hypothetical protein